MLKWVLVVLLVGLAAACSSDIHDASAVAEGSASLGADEAIKVTATVRVDDVAGRVREDDNLPAPRGGEDASIAFNVRSSGTSRSAEDIHVGTEIRLVGLPGNFEGRWGNRPSELSVGGFDPSLECTDGICEGDIVMYALPRENDEVLRADDVVPPDTEIAWPVETEWKLTASVDSSWGLVDSPVEIEVVAQEIVAGYAWEAKTEIDFDSDAALLWQAVHFAIDFPPDTLPRHRFDQDTLAWLSHSPGNLPLDEGTVGGNGLIRCGLVDGCDSLGFTRLLNPAADVGSETVADRATGLLFELDNPSESTATATATAGADQAVRASFSGILDKAQSSYLPNFSISLVHPGHNDGWPVIAYIDARSRSGKDHTESPQIMVLTECRSTPCSEEFYLPVPRNVAPIEWQLEAVVVPWSNEDTGGIEIEVTALPQPKW